jgi:hypothetical protein
VSSGWRYLHDPFSIAGPNMFVVAAFDFRLTLESCVGPTYGGWHRGYHCPLSDPDAVANISFDIGTAAAGSLVTWVVSLVLRATSQGIKWNKSSLLPVGPCARLTGVFHAPQLLS